MVRANAAFLLSSEVWNRAGKDGKGFNNINDKIISLNVLLI